MTCSVMQYVAVCFSVMYCFKACCNELQYVSQCVLQRVTARCSLLKICCNMLQCVAVCCSDFQCVSVCFSVMHYFEACCKKLQRVSQCVLQCVAVC